MRFWLLSALLNGFFALVMHFAAPEMVGSTAYYAGVIICTLIALVVTWGDPPGLLDRVLVFVVEWGILLLVWRYLFGGSVTSLNSGAIMNLP